MRPAAIAFVTAGFLASIAAAAVVANFAVAKLEDATLRNAKTALVASGQGWVEINTNGTLVELTGTAPNERRRMMALDAIGGVVSSSRIRDGLDVEESVAAVAPDFALEILRSGTDVSLIGIAPLEGDLDIVRGAVERIANVALIDMKESTDWEAPEGWQAALGFGVEIMTLTDRAKISIEPGEVHVTAVVKSDAEKRALQQQLVSIRPADIVFSIDITAPRPIFAPYKLTLTVTDEETALACYALTQEGAARILAAAERVGVAPGTSCEIGLGAPTETWADAAVAGIEAVGKLGGGKLEMLDSVVTLTAPLGFDPEAFNTIGLTYRKVLPPSYAFKSILPEVEVVNDDTRPYFHAQLRDDGSALMNGVSIDEISKRTLLTYAEAKFGHGSVNDITKIADFAPHGWTSRQLVALEVLSMLRVGNINVTEDTVTVTGTGETEGLYDAILGKLEVGFGADAQFQIAVEEDVPPPVVESLPDAKACEAEIAALLAENQILFAPSSAVIDSSSVRTINSIVTILNRCNHAAFEIGGHTDSQGREEMNKNLSQSRADAVLDSLLARNMLLGELTAVGYGESQPIADNETEEGRQENRRIAFKLLEDTADGQN